MLLLLLGGVIFVAKGTLARSRDNPEAIERSLAQVNLCGFSEALLRSALYPDVDPQQPISRTAMMRLLNTPEAQDAARNVAFKEMVAKAPEASRIVEKGRGDPGWLDSMCDAMPWISYMVECAIPEDPDDLLPSEIKESHITLPTDKFVWASCA